jgi:serine/threonine protein phosphatase PrpC
MYGIINVIGKRDYMEDFYIVDEHFLPDKNGSLYVVLDGHGGDTVAKRCMERLPAILKKNITRFGMNNIHDALIATFYEIDELFDIREDYMTGTTCLVILRFSDKLWIANCGDSRAFINAQSQCDQLTQDHKPDKAEKKRIEDLNGMVANVDGVWRVNGELAVSRAIGDKRHRPFVIPTPEVSVYTLTPQNKFFVIATDGLWDIMECETVNNMIYDIYKDSSKTDIDVIKKGITQLYSTIKSNIYDNTTVILIHLRR